MMYKKFGYVSHSVTALVLKMKLITVAVSVQDPCILGFRLVSCLVTVLRLIL